MALDWVQYFEGYAMHFSQEGMVISIAIKLERPIKIVDNIYFNAWVP